MRTLTAKNHADFAVIAYRVQTAVNEARFLFREEDEWKGRDGGYFCLADAETGLPYLVTLIGSVSGDKAEKYCAFAQEKARRLASRPDHVSSWQSRNPKKEKYGGAIRYWGFIHSFSGFSELGDEALMLLASYYATPTAIRVSFIDVVVALSSNPYWKPLSGFMHKHSIA